MLNKKSEKEDLTKSGEEIVDEEMTSPEVTENGSFKIGKFIIGLAVGIIGLLIVLLAVFSFLFYRNPGADSFANKVVKTMNLPLASVKGEFITYNDFSEDYEILSHYYSNGLEKGLIDASQVPSDNELKSNILNQIINKILIEKLAERYDLSISDIEVETTWQKEILAGFNSEEEAADTIKEAYNMNVEQFKNKVVRENLLYNKLAEAVQFDAELQSDAKTRAQEVMDKLNAGENFEDLAKQYSEDEYTAPNGGDLDWFPRGVMVPEFETAAFALDPGETSGLVKTSFGYHIIKVLEKRDASEDGEQGEEVHAEHILIKGFSIDNYLEEERNSNDVKKYVNFLES